MAPESCQYDGGHFLRPFWIRAPLLCGGLAELIFAAWGLRRTRRCAIVVLAHGDGLAWLPGPAAPQRAAPIQPRARVSSPPTAAVGRGDRVRGRWARAEEVAAAAPPTRPCAPPTREGRSRSGVGRRGRAVPERGEQDSLAAAAATAE